MEEDKSWANAVHFKTFEHQGSEISIYTIPNTREEYIDIHKKIADIIYRNSLIPKVKQAE